jgi:hypothetical protein
MKNFDNINFTLENFNSNNGMLPSVWGPLMWHFLHVMSFNYPVKPNKKTKEQYYSFINHLKYILPCKKCRQNIEKNLIILNFNISHMKNRYTFSKFIYSLHDLVNKGLHKKSPDYYDVRNFYECFRSECTSSKIIKDKGCYIPKYKKKYKCKIKILENIETIKDLKDTKIIYEPKF